MKILLGLQDLWDIVEGGYDERYESTLNENQEMYLRMWKKDKKVLFVIY